MIKDNVQVKTVKLAEKIKGFQDIADIKQPEKGDIYISSSSGHLKVWEHSNTGKLLKVVLRPYVSVNLYDLPKGILVSKGKYSDEHFHTAPGINLDRAILSNRWQANTWRNCPFMKGTVKIEVRKFNGPRSGIMSMNHERGEAFKFDWDRIAQFRVLGLCDDVEYKNDKGKVKIEIEMQAHFHRSNFSW